MDNVDHWTIHAMIKTGGSFVKALGLAAQQADDDNLCRIKVTWPVYWNHYAKMGERLQQKEKEKNGQV